MKLQNGLTATLLRFLPVLALVLGTAVFLQAHYRSENVPQSADPGGFPREVSGMLGRDEAIQQDVLDVLGPGKFVSRVYTSSTTPWIDFFMGYFPSQRTGDTIHSPKNCLPGSGWTPVNSGYVTVKRNGRSVKVNRYVIARRNEQQLVLYWYQSHGRVVASEYWAKYYLVADSIRLNRTDAALVRIITPVIKEEGGMAKAEARAVAFAQTIFPDLDKYIPE